MLYMPYQQFIRILFLEFAGINTRFLGRDGFHIRKTGLKVLANNISMAVNSIKTSNGHFQSSVKKTNKPVVKTVDKKCDSLSLIETNERFILSYDGNIHESLSVCLRFTPTQAMWGR